MEYILMIVSVITILYFTICRRSINRLTEMVFVAFLMVACTRTNSSDSGFISVDSVKTVMKIDTTECFTVYYPSFSKIELICGEQPSEDNDSIIYCASAAFTARNLQDLVGDYVSNGELHKNGKANTKLYGCFTYSNGIYRFTLDNTTYRRAVLEEASKLGGMGFTQWIVINDGVANKHLQRKDNPQFQFRTLCEKDGKLCIVESLKKEKYSEYVKNLEELGVKYAIYMDMGYPWNYSFWRVDDGTLHTFCKKPAASIDYRTNWIVFYK